MKRHIKYMVLFIFSQTQVFAQLNPPVEPFEQIKWKNLETKWHVTEFDEGMISDSCDGYNYFYNLFNDPKKVFIKDEFISTFFLRGKRTSPTGHYLVKRNLTTGELIWNLREDITMTKNRSNITRALFLDEDSNLIHIGLVPIETYPKAPSPYGATLKTQLSKKIIDINSGQELSKIFPDNIDTTIVIMPQAFVKYGNYCHIYVEGDNYRVIHPVKYVDKLDFKLVSFLVDQEGRRVGNIDSIPYKEGQRFLNFAKVDGETFLYIENSKILDTLTYYFVDKQLKTKSKIKFKKDVNIHDMLLLDMQHDNLLFYDFDNETNPFEPPVRVLRYDLNGNKFQDSKVNMDNHQKHPIPLFYGKTDELFLFTLYAKKLGTGNWDFSMNVYKMTQDSMVLVSAFKGEDKDRFVYITSVYELPDGDILLEVEETNMIMKNNSYQQDGNARSISTMRISPEALGLIPTSTKTEIYADQLNIYPNPSEGSIRIVFPNGINEGVLEVYDSSGKKVKSQEFDKHLSNFFDMGDLSAGMYFLKAMDKSGRRTEGKLVMGKR